MRKSCQGGFQRTRLDEPGFLNVDLDIRIEKPELKYAIALIGVHQVVNGIRHVIIYQANMTRYYVDAVSRSGRTTINEFYPLNGEMGEDYYARLRRR